MHALKPFTYHRPASVDEALALWASTAEAMYLAGGTDLLGRMRSGQFAPKAVIDIKRIEELGRIELLDDGSLAIGAAVSVAATARHPEVQSRYPVLVQCCDELGSYPLRQRATVIGNICNASPCADTAPALLCLDASVDVAGKNGRRRIPMMEFFRGPGQSALEPGELACRVILPAASIGGRAHYGRLARRKAVDIATVGALVLHLPKVEPHHRVVLVSVAPIPLRLPEVERLLDAKGPAAADEAAEMAIKACSPITDLRGTAEYRREMVGVLVKRGVEVLAQG